MSRHVITRASLNLMGIVSSKFGAFRRRSRRSRPYVGSAGRRQQAMRGHGEGGFTLVEMLVVITIIGLVMGLVGPRVLSYLGDAKVKAAKLQIESFGSALDLFYLDAGRYPSASEGLTALVQRPAGVSVWNGPYLKNASVPVDPWGHVYLYRVPGEKRPYQIISLGSDGQEGGTGTAADIGNGETLAAAAH
ncbi:general secretion pathway protein G [Bradyrhizobium erythrophlei]|uniref:Type II secretion system core protein G n=2 Tax=Bradyrhizobium erythrophlei TaxID=1437360 RepID=A0A1M7UY25_9BRAD|nr:general secretion pathway protein G [Bradyrhizobium erythrophlei]